LGARKHPSPRIRSYNTSIYLDTELENISLLGYRIREHPSIGYKAREHPSPRIQSYRSCLSLDTRAREHPSTCIQDSENPSTWIESRKNIIPLLRYRAYLDTDLENIPLLGDRTREHPSILHGYRAREHPSV
jgi:hypothetical protein